MCLAELRANAHYRAREQTKPTGTEKLISDFFEMIPHWPGIVEQDGQFRLTQKLLTKESLLDHKGVLRLAFELPPIMLPRRVTP